MKFPTPGWLGTTLILLTTLPVAGYLGFTRSVWRQHLKTTVSNDPQAELSRSLSTVQSALNQRQSEILLKATRLAGKENLKKLLTSKKMNLAQVKSLAAGSFNPDTTPLLILTDKKGDALYTSFPLPSPSPAAPTVPRNRRGKVSPSLPSVKDWSGIRQALQGASNTGLFSYQDKLYLAAALPINSPKVVGTLLIGEPFGDAFAQELKKSVQNDLAFFSDRKILFSTLAVALESQVLKALPAEWQTSGAPPSKPMTINQDPCVWNFVPVSDIKQEPSGYFLVFQPIQQITTVEGFPQKRVLSWGVGLILLLVLIGYTFSVSLLSTVRKLTLAVERIQTGDLGVALPTRRMDELGRLGRALQGMLESLREKERISLILGKVVDPQAARKILAEKDYFSLKGERRECTLLQADLKAFNTLSENMTPEALVEALNQYFSLINEIVFKHEGMLDKFIGGTAVVVWGAPFNHGDKEERAAKAAMEIQEALKEFNISRIKKGHPPFTIGIGIHTGTVVSGNLGSDKRYDYSIIGEALQVVSRLCAMAAPGQIVVSQETYGKIRDLVKANALNPIAVKGSLEPLATFEITQWL